MANTKKIGSPLSSAFNNIVNFTSSRPSITKTQTSYNSFLGMMSRETKALEAIKLPKRDKISKLANLNIASTFGNVGNLLSSVASGALDIAGFVGNFFGRNKEGQSIKPQKPLLGGGGKLKFGGLKAIGITNALFAGLDFATGLAEGESVGKSAAGAGGALAGSLLGGVIGQALIPIPPLGFIVGSMAGNFLGGYAADRVYESATGTGGDVTSKEKEKLKQKEREQRARAAEAGKLTLPQVMNKFDAVVAQFARLSNNVSPGSSISSDWGPGETGDDQEFDYKNKGTKATPTGTGDEVFPLPSGNPQFNTTTGYMGGTFSSTREGGRKHKAQDIGVNPNSPVVATRNGKIIDKYYNYGGHGDALIIKYDNGQQGLYGHIKAQSKIGDEVKAGQQIGTVYDWGGNTHLHYMRKDTKGQDIDPMPYLNSSKSGVFKVEPKKEDKKKNLDQKSQFKKDSADQPQNETKKQEQQRPTVTPKTPTVPTVKSQPTTQVPSETKVSSSETQGTKDTLMAMASAAPPQTQQLTSPSEISQYTTYNQPTVAGESVIIPIMMGSSSPPQVESTPQSPSNIGGSPAVASGPSAGDVLNRFIKDATLATLSA
jgi:murein DD-endopeptidase MepM/ murein hydrolase activator NlpD